MPYIKLLTALAGLALLTACGGGGGGTTGTIADPCVGNPFATGCTTSTDAQKLAFCRDTNQTTDSKTNDCGPVVSDICTPNPFDTICTDHVSAQENFCGDATRTTATKDADCAPVVMRVCMENVRNLILCTANVYVQERMRLDNACLVRTGSQAVCDEEVRVATCDADPFPANCVEQEYLDARQSACLMDLEADTTCGGTNGLATIFCRANPFDDALACRDPVYLPFRTSYCETNGDVAACPNINYGKWRDSFKGEDALGTAPANLNGNVDIGFLADLTTTTPVITGLTNNAYNPVTFADFNGGDARGGSVFWLGTWGDRNSITNYHAGILATTDVGAPLDNATQSGSWVGQFQALNTSLNPPRSDVDFILTVNFNAKTIYAFLENVKVGSDLEVDYEIGGVFDPTTGVITGTAEYGRDDGLGSTDDNNVGSNGALEEGDRSYIGGGILTGLIGQHGATGAFRIQVRDIYIVGGFVAVPKNLIVNHADWAEGLGAPATAATSRITETITDEVNGRFVITFKTPPESLTGAKVVARFDGQPISQTLLGGFYRHVAAGVNSVGLLERTNVGAPLGDTFSVGVTKATWNGMIQGDNVNNTDFMLEIDLTNDRVEAFYQTADLSQYYHFKGGYSATGLLTGTVNYGEFSTLASEGVSPVAMGNRVNNGIFRGIIGQFGAAAVFVSGTGVVSATGQPTDGGTGTFFGGFLVTPTAQLNPNANFNDWRRDFGRTPPPATLTAGKNQFLAGGPTGLDTITGVTSVENVAISSLTRASARFNDLPLLQSGEADDGVAFFYDTVATNDYNYYAGILSGTDLGAPIEGVAATTAQWEGQFRAFRDNSGIEEDNVDFVLDITFAGKTGSIESYVVIDADEGAYYHVDGTYNAQGVISGSVDFGEFRGVGTATITPDDENSEGILTGLIGEQGAVGAFIGGTGTKEALADLASGKIAYVGGFVAAPFIDLEDTTSTMVEFNDWRRDFGRYIPIATLTAGENQFLLGDTAGLTTTGATNATEDNLTLSSAMFNGMKLLEAGQAADGVAFFYDTIDNGAEDDSYNYYAGLLSGTNLGAPITGTAATTAKWEGQFKAFLDNDGTIETHNEDFVLDITFNGNTGSIESYVLIDAGEGVYYHVVGTYDARGAISGSVDFGEFTGVGTATITPDDENSEGILTGLIGAQGAVGVFIANGADSTKQAITATTGTAYVGGFVAAPYVNLVDTTPTSVAINDWIHDFGRYPPPATIDLSDADTDIFGSFLNIASGETTITTTSLKTEASGSTASTSVILPLAVGNDMDGVVYISGFNGANNQAFVGLLPTTDLGAPFAVSATEVEWEGFYYDSTLTTAQNAITFDIDFTARSIGVKAGSITAASPPAFALGFNSAGVITGTVTKDSIEATALGLIGAEGLVGAFIDTAPTTGNVFHGGFVAAPPPVVNYADWVDVTSPDTTRATPLANQFLTGADAVSTPTNGTVGFVTLNNAKPTGMDTTAFGGDSNDGLQLYSNDRSTGADPTNFYTGILTTTNLGAPLTMQTAEGTWQGRLYTARDTVAVNAETLINSEAADFVPTVNFSTKTISANITGVTKLFGVDIAADTVSYDFTAVWDARGVFQGTINRNLSDVASAGKLTGLIGQGGAVGVFISNAGAAVGYAGGFVARKAP